VFSFDQFSVDLLIRYIVCVDQPSQEETKEESWKDHFTLRNINSAMHFIIENYRHVLGLSYALNFVQLC
jgi:hypothetical protein